MITRLVISELVSAWRLWVGAFVVAVFAALVALVCAGDFSTAAVITDKADAGALRNHALVFGLINLPVVIGALNILLVFVVRLQRSHHALWQFAGIGPRLIVRIVLGQATILGLIAFGLSVAVAKPVLNLLLNTLASPIRGAEASPLRTIALGPIELLVALVVFMVVVVGSAFGAARSASRTPAIHAVRAPQEEPARPNRGRLVLALVFAGLTVALIVLRRVTDSGFLDLGQVTWIVAFLFIAPWASGWVMNRWTSLPPAHSSAWFLAREFARYNVTRSHAGISLLVVAAGIGAFTGHAGVWTTPGYFIIGLAIFGVPILIVLIAGGATVVMTALERRGETALLVVAGATYRIAVLAAVLEAVIFVVTAGLLSLVIALPSIVDPVPGTPRVDAVTPIPFVLLVGVVIMLTATMTPVLQARNKPLATEIGRAVS